MLPSLDVVGFRYLFFKIITWLLKHFFCLFVPVDLRIGWTNFGRLPASRDFTRARLAALTPALWLVKKYI